MRVVGALAEPVAVLEALLAALADLADVDGPVQPQPDGVLVERHESLRQLAALVQVVVREEPEAH